MGMMETIVFGLFALTLVVVAISINKSKPLLSSILGATTIILICLSAHNWWLALGDSGKNQRWLGYEQYPIALVTCVIIAVSGLFCIIFGTVRFFRKKSLQRNSALNE